MRVYVCAYVSVCMVVCVCMSVSICVHLRVCAHVCLCVHEHVCGLVCVSCAPYSELPLSLSLSWRSGTSYFARSSGSMCCVRAAILDWARSSWNTCFLCLASCLMMIRTPTTSEAANSDLVSYLYLQYDNVFIQQVTFGDSHTFSLW